MASQDQTSLKLAHRSLAGVASGMVQTCFMTSFGRKAVSSTPEQHSLKLLCILKQRVTSTGSQSTRTTEA